MDLTWARKTDELALLAKGLSSAAAIRLDQRVIDMSLVEQRVLRREQDGRRTRGSSHSFKVMAQAGQLLAAC
eukprot:41536-Eustigmatos_ZCMA.PRE.1